MVSGIKCSDEVFGIYKQLKIDRTLKALVLKVNDATQVEVETQIPVEGFTYEAFMSKFPEDDGRFGVIDFAYQTAEGLSQSKIVFILWCPINCKPMKKMKYSTSVNGISEELGAVSLLVQADSPADITHESILRKITGKFK